MRVGKQHRPIAWYSGTPLCDVIMRHMANRSHARRQALPLRQRLLKLGDSRVRDTVSAWLRAYAQEFR